MTFAAKAVARPPALIREQVAEQIREAITEQRLVPGQVLVERELCEATTASRATVREALRQLESEGLVVSSSGRGTVVATLTPEVAQEIYEVRASLEGMAGRLFANRANDAERRELQRAALALEEAAEDPRQYLTSKRKFYAVLVDGARNSELNSILNLINRRVTMLRVISLSQPGRTEKSLAEIKAICEAAVTGDADLTESLCRQHVDNAAAAAIGALNAPPAS